MHVPVVWPPVQFQHTAARRRLHGLFHNGNPAIGVSTHSRPKAAARLNLSRLRRRRSFNTQPPEGGCVCLELLSFVGLSFNTQPPEGGCSLHKKVRKIS